MRTFDCVANGRRIKIRAYGPQQAAKKATTLARIESGEVEVQTEAGPWLRYLVLGRRYVLPLGRDR